ncbi:TolC family protein [Sphingomonas sp. 28-62-20]|uniref:TolC family protein n=1 Tax=Sphingomonas sp. 28-62-20 TaxID=1970433 RepID=UPI00269267A0
MLKQTGQVLTCVGVAMLLGGCATVQPGLDPPQINKLLAARGAPELGWEKNTSGADAALVTQWLGEPMTAERAVRVAMLRSPRLQEEYAKLGLARADIMEAVQIANPRFSIGKLNALGGPGSQLALGLTMPLVDLLVLPARARLARSDFERAKLAIAASVLGVGFDVESAWYAYVGAQQVADMRAAVASGMATSAELARRYYAAGNISELQLKREEAAASQAQIDAARAAVAARMARLQLNTAIGLSGPDAEWRTSDRLPLPVATEDDPVLLETMANQGNLALLAQAREVDILRDAAGITRHTRLLGDAQIGFERERETDGSKIQGPTASIEIPIFNQGGARVARAEARYLQARAQLLALQLKTDNAVRLGAERVQVLADIVKTHREALIPARETIVERSQQEQNYMLIGVFELIQAKTQEYDAYQGYLEAIRDYWLARIDLMRVVGARLPSEQEVSGQTPSVSEILTPRGIAMDHSGHGAASAGPTAAPEPMADMPGMDHSVHDAPPSLPSPPPPPPAHQHPGGPS